MSSNAYEPMRNVKILFINERARVAHCCVLSRETLLFGWIWRTGSGLDHSRPKKSNCQVPEHMSYYSATLPGCWNSQKNKARSVAHHHKMWSARLWVRSPRGQFAFHLFFPVIMIVSIQYAYSDDCCAHWSFLWSGSSSWLFDNCNFTSELRLRGNI